MSVLSPAQRATLKTNILATPAALQLYQNGDLQGLADFYNALAAPAFIVWRTDVTRSQIYHQVSAESTSWSWQTYKAQSQGEQGAWTQMFMGDSADFSLPNLRAGVENIFGAANAQTVHCKAIAKRSARVLEKLLAVGTGSTPTPATMTFEGEIPYTEFMEL